MPVEFIVPLDREGNGAGNIRPIGKPRVVDLRPGDSFVHGPTQKRYKLAAMSAYRQHTLTDEMIAAGQIPSDGYLVHDEAPHSGPAQCERQPSAGGTMRPREEAGWNRRRQSQHPFLHVFIGQTWAKIMQGAQRSRWKPRRALETAESDEPTRKRPLLERCDEASFARFRCIAQPGFFFAGHGRRLTTYFDFLSRFGGHPRRRFPCTVDGT
jgi:hypothetical protein